MELVPALARAGVEIDLITPRWSGDLGDEVIQVTALDPAHPTPPPTTVYRVQPHETDPADFFSFAWRTNIAIEDVGRRLLAQHSYDLIHVHDWLVAFAGVALKHAFRLPLVATIHATEYGRHRGHPEGEMPRAINNVEWWLSYEAWRVICCSQFMAREIQTALRTPADKIDVIPNGVDTSRFDGIDQHDLTAFRRRFALDDEEIIFFVGRVVFEKGVQLLVEAMPELLRRRPTVKLIVAGTGGHLNAVRERARQLGLGDKALFTGFISDEDRDRLIGIAAVAAFPSLYEPFGIVALEAMASRTPVVVAGGSGLSEVVTNHETGVIVYPDDVESLIWGIIHTLENPAWAQARVGNAYQVVRDRYNWDTIAAATVDVYRRVAAERAGSDW
jgi:glycosyltransferase involved in cell wall biosynthesis